MKSKNEASAFDAEVQTQPNGPLTPKFAERAKAAVKQFGLATIAEKSGIAPSTLDNLIRYAADTIGGPPKNTRISTANAIAEAIRQSEATVGQKISADRDVMTAVSTLRDHGFTVILVAGQTQITPA